eukprot:Gregarina_sp_Poly_1__10217@NODE_709_length_6670_cov_39_483265_g536_i0_p5_GENE_NODE_709_length_6670_cov_39_483265_g536_i0NODE_709_length_6670_cov_39_483265_g536_i0_p5_ORF_typecomplete_len174_score18_19_NODE_709_length_6670_cov_39_483265_g536_i070591
MHSPSRRKRPRPEAAYGTSGNSKQARFGSPSSHQGDKLWDLIEQSANGSIETENSSSRQVPSLVSCSLNEDLSPRSHTSDRVASTAPDRVNMSPNTSSSRILSFNFSRVGFCRQMKPVVRKTYTDEILLRGGLVAEGLECDIWVSSSICCGSVSGKPRLHRERYTIASVYILD